MFLGLLSPTVFLTKTNCFNSLDHMHLHAFLIEIKTSSKSCHFEQQYWAWHNVHNMSITSTFKDGIDHVGLTPNLRKWHII